MDIEIDSPDRMSLDADGVARLYTAHAEAMLGFFMRRTYEPEAAMDLVAETFACAFRDRRHFRGSGEREQAAWLYGIARHRLIDFARRGRVERAALKRLGFHRRALSDSEYERVEELAGLAEVRELLAAGLDGLGSEQRVALQLRVLEGAQLRRARRGARRERADRASARQPRPARDAQLGCLERDGGER